MYHKKVYYSVNPRYFKDSNGNGVGDLIGLAKQIDYFKFLGVDAIILQDIFAYNHKKRPFMEIDEMLGQNEHLKLIVKHFHNHKLRILIELPFDYLKHNYLWLKNAENMATDFATRELYLLEDLTSELSINSDQTLLTNLIEIVNLWQTMQIDGIVVKNFEYLGNVHHHKTLTPRTINLLKELYVRVKTLNKDFFWSGLSANLSYEQIQNFASHPHKLFDQVMSYEIAHIDIHKHNHENFQGKFKVKKLVNHLKKLKQSKNTVLIFGTPQSGRIISRWGDELGYWKEASKCLAMLFYLNQNDNNLFFADEIGLTNYHFQFDEHLQDAQTNAQKRRLQARGFKINKITQKQKLHHYKNAQQAMPWNESINGGFSSCSPCNILINERFKENNVANQFKDENSVLEFNRQLIKLVKSKFFNKIISFGTWHIKTKWNGVVVIKGKNNFNSFRAYINFSPFKKHLSWFHIVKRQPIALTTYQNHSGKTLPISLQGYEGIILVNTSQDYAKDQTMFWKTRKQKKPVTSSEQTESELQDVKTKSQLEREAVKKIRDDFKKMDDEEAALLEQERTTLTDEEIAKTVQVDIEGVDDLEDFIKKNLSPPEDNE